VSHLSASKVKIPLEKEMGKKNSTHQKKLQHLEDKVRNLTEKLLDAFEELNIFYDISQSLSNIYDVKAICDLALAQIVEIVHSEKASIALMDGDGDQTQLTIKSYLGFSEDVVDHKIKIKGTLYEEVIKRRKPLAAEEINQELITTPKSSQYKTKSFILQPIYTLPMTISEEVIGVISLADKADKESFTAQDIKFLFAIATQVAMSIQNARLVTNLKESLLITVRSLSAAIDAKDPYTHGHSERVTECALGIGQTLGISKAELEQLEMACLLHDVGKIGIPEVVLNKRSKLSLKEIKLIRNHSLKGVEILKNTKQTKSLMAGVRHHHERYNGKGYPDSLAGEQIPLLARIIAVADSYDAMVSDRPYRRKRSSKAAVEEIQSKAGVCYDPKVVWAFIKWIDKQKKLH
jgi:HD-GYP domain-containing protein (c-di-GMP phosphodiesterase class II)